MALKIVTAPMGTGKTLLLIRMIFEYLADGRRVYSNISGLKIAEVLPISSTYDWRDLPDGSVVIYDEGHEHPAFSKEDIIDFPEFEDYEIEQLESENITTYKARVAKLKKSYDRRKKQHRDSIIDIARALKMHRHWGFDIIICTQDSAELNTRVTNIVNEHYHLTRPFGFKHNVLFFWRRHVSNPDSVSERSRAEWKKHISFNKSYFHLYHSSNIHTHKASVPIKYIIVAFIVLCFCILPFYLISNNKAMRLMSGKKEEVQKNDIVVDKEMPISPDALSAELQQQQSQQQQTTNQQQQVTIQKDEQQISGCVYFAGKYTAVDEFARPIHSKSHLCKQVIQDADRNFMKKPSIRSVQNYNEYSADAELQLKTQQLQQQEYESVEQLKRQEKN